MNVSYILAGKLQGKIVTTENVYPNIRLYHSPFIATNIGLKKSAVNVQQFINNIVKRNGKKPLSNCIFRLEVFYIY